MPSKSFSETTSNIPGILETIESIIQLERTREERLLNAASENQRTLGAQREIESVAIDPQFLRSLIFHSNLDYLKLAIDDRCTFYSLIDNTLLQSSGGQITNIPIIYKTNEGEQYNALVERQDFIQYITRDECFRNREIRELFSPSNLQSTLASINFETPTTKKQCHEIHETWLNNRYLPYLCRIPETERIIDNSRRRLNQTPQNQPIQRQFYQQLISSNQRYLSNVEDFQKIYLRSLCSNLYQPDKFCEQYLTPHVWGRILSMEEPSYKMSFQCALHLNKKFDEVTASDLRTCSAVFTESPNTCQTLRHRSFPSNFPLSDCDTLSETLTISRLKTPYKDCPGQIDHEAITNLHRIINHYAPREFSTKAESCTGEAIYSFSKLHMESRTQENWPFKICFHNPVVRREECRNYIPGDHKESDISETKVIRDILNQITSTPEGLECRMVPKSIYRPTRLEFQAGCHIVYDESNCTFLHCDKTIYLNENKIDSITYKDNPKFHYFAPNHSIHRESSAFLIGNKFDLRSREIRSLTDLRVFLEQNPDSIIHGMGCIEDIMPHSFNKTNLNECRPVPFIVDGQIQDGPDTLVSIRTSTDDIHNPQLISWSYILNAVAAYSRLHPTRLWTLYGLH